jgi:hypothetical protein
MEGVVMGAITRPVGRPTKYSPELQAQADDYVLNWSKTDSVPSRVGLCCWLGISKHTSFEWEKIYPEFSATLDAVEALQEHTAMNKGITGEFNSTIVKLVLANHGYSDKVQQDVISSDGSAVFPSRIEIVAPKQST